jgi:Mg2+ and Co2+ transporter CorA
MPQYITATEAVELTGKSAATISRLCTKHAGSIHLKKDGRSWLIDRDWLLKEVGEHIAHEISRNFMQEPEKQSTERKTLEQVTDEITRLQDEMINHLKGENNFLRGQVNQLTERNREMNILLGNAQRQIQSRPEPEPAKQPQPIPVPKKELDPNWVYLMWFAGILFVLIALAAYFKTSM